MKAACVIVLLCVLCTSAFALEWQHLHNEANTTTVDNALALLGKAPDSLERLYVVGLAYLNRYEIDEAKKYFEKILARDAQNIEAQWGVAEILRRKHQYKESKTLLEGILKKDPSFSPAYISLAYLRYTEGAFEDATRLLIKVIQQGDGKVDSTNRAVAHSLYAGMKGMIAHFGGPVSKVVNGSAVMQHLQTAQKLQPDNPAVYFGFGSYYLLIPKIFGRDIDKGIEYLKKAIEVDPHLADAYVRLAQGYKAKGDMEKYNAYLLKALQLDPQNEIALDVKSGTCRFICLE